MCVENSHRNEEFQRQPGKMRYIYYLENEMATHSSILHWKIPWTEAPSRPQFMESQKRGHDLLTKQREEIRVSDFKGK